jgi:hypothetical protein
VFWKRILYHSIQTTSDKQKSENIRLKSYCCCIHLCTTVSHALGISWCLSVSLKFNIDSITQNELSSHAILSFWWNRIKFQLTIASYTIDKYGQEKRHSVFYKCCWFSIKIEHMWLCFGRHIPAAYLIFISFQSILLHWTCSFTPS